MLVIAVVLAVVVGGGAFAVYKTDPFHLFSSGPQAAEAVPANAIFYLGVDVDPSAQQKVNALRFLNHFPAFRDASGVQDENTDVRRTILEKVLESYGCTDVSYASDVEPWIGSKFALAGMPPVADSTEPAPMFALEVSDEAAAKTGLEKLASCTTDGPSGDFGLAFTGDYAVVAQTQDLADKYAAAADSGSLADDDDFSSDMDSLGDLGVATAWADIDGVIDLFGQDLSVAGSAPSLDFLRSTYQRAAATFRFESDRAEFVTSVFGSSEGVDHGENQIVELPDSTVFAASLAGGGDRFAAAWPDIARVAKESGVDFDAQLSSFEAQTGLNVPADVETLLGDNLLFALDSESLTAEALQSGDPTLFNAGLRFTGDKEQLNAVYEKVLALVQQQAGTEMPFTKVDTDDGLVIATNDSYAGTLSGQGNLGDTDAFQSVVDNGGDEDLVMFFNFDQVEDQILQAAESSGAPPEFTENLRVLKALGLTSHTDGGYSTSILVVSVND